MLRASKTQHKHRSIDLGFHVWSADPLKQQHLLLKMPHPDLLDQNLHFHTIPGWFSCLLSLRCTDYAAFNFISPHWPMRECYTVLSNVHKETIYETEAAGIPSCAEYSSPLLFPIPPKVVLHGLSVWQSLRSVPLGLLHLAFINLIVPTLILCLKIICNLTVPRVLVLFGRNALLQISDCKKKVRPLTKSKNCFLGLAFKTPPGEIRFDSLPFCSKWEVV